MTAKTDGLHGTVLSAGRSEFDDAKVDEVRADGDTLHLRLTLRDTPFTFVFYRPNGEASPDRLLGSTVLRTQRDFVRLERTDQKNLDKKESTVVNDPGRDLERAIHAEPGAAKEAALRKVIEQQAGRSDEYVARLELLGSLASHSDEDELHGEADRIVAFANPYGPEMSARRCVCRHEAARFRKALERGA